MKQTTSDTHPEASVWRPDATVACVVPQNGRFLLVEEEVGGKRVLNQPAGHLEPDETLFDAACRETLEETGWEVRLSDFVGVYQWANADGTRHFLRFTFAADAIRHDPGRPLDAGIVRGVWLTREEIAAAGPRLRSPMVLRCIDDWLAGKRFPLDTVVPLLDAAQTQ